MNIRSEWLDIYRSYLIQVESGQEWWDMFRLFKLGERVEQPSLPFWSLNYFLQISLESKEFMSKKVLLYTCTHYNRCPSGLITTYNRLLGEPESTPLSQVNSLEYIWRVSEGQEFFKDWVNLNVRYLFCKRSQSIHCSFVRSWDTRLQTPILEVDMFMLWIPWPTRQL